jgi:flagellin-specific chaperone FliS
MYANPQSTQRYRELQVMTATPIQRLLMVYDAAVMGCNQRDLKRTTDALNVLRGSLNFEYAEVAFGFFRIYQYCGDLAREGRYDEAANLLRGLVQAWVEGLVRERDSAQPEVAERPALSIAG